jgi:tetratricopeptide (TPR) repeat protein
LHAVILAEMGRFPEALEIRLQEMALSLRIKGPNHPDHATSCYNCALLYAKLNQMQDAIDLEEKALAIYMKTFGPSHEVTLRIHKELASYQLALTDPAMKKRFVKTRDRMCSIDNCHSIEKGMNRCMSCGTHYLCKKHEGKIHEHVSVCPKFADLLPDEKKGKTIVKCRRCRNETKLMKCSVCEGVWYCGATCQKEDWEAT